MEKKKKNCKHLLIEWRKYNFSEEIDIIDKRCRLCWGVFFFMRTKVKEK